MRINLIFTTVLILLVVPKRPTSEDGVDAFFVFVDCRMRTACPGPGRLERSALNWSSLFTALSMVHFTRSAQRSEVNSLRPLLKNILGLGDECQKLTVRRGAPVKIFKNWTLTVTRGQACDDHSPARVRWPEKSLRTQPQAMLGQCPVGDRLRIAGVFRTQSDVSRALPGAGLWEPHKKKRTNKIMTVELQRSGHARGHFALSFCPIMPQKGHAASAPEID
ncbi:hypothetical protein RRG08_047612 [Elysia crispata]|uniref:Secreted protein n=1 Tax=Elysia crispata TaxID=231223 RepID=A0AAE1BD77_9GAST|nr:hypothetical protein RRG08_047612 [Elysia crispata]